MEPEKLSDDVLECILKDITSKNAINIASAQEKISVILDNNRPPRTNVEKYNETIKYVKAEIYTMIEQKKYNELKTKIRNIVLVARFVQQIQNNHRKINNILDSKEVQDDYSSEEKFQASFNKNKISTIVDNSTIQEYSVSLKKLLQDSGLKIRSKITKHDKYARHFIIPLELLNEFRAKADLETPWLIQSLSEGVEKNISIFNGFQGNVLGDLNAVDMSKLNTLCCKIKDNHEKGDILISVIGHSNSSGELGQFAKKDVVHIFEKILSNFHDFDNKIIFKVYSCYFIENIICDNAQNRDPDKQKQLETGKERLNQIRIDLKNKYNIKNLKFKFYTQEVVPNYFLWQTGIYEKRSCSGSKKSLSSGNLSCTAYNDHVLTSILLGKTNESDRSKRLEDVPQNTTEWSAQHHCL